MTNDEIYRTGAELLYGAVEAIIMDTPAEEALKQQVLLAARKCGIKQTSNPEGKLDEALGKDNWFIGKGSVGEACWFAYADWNAETEDWRYGAETDTLGEALKALLEYVESLKV